MNQKINLHRLLLKSSLIIGLIAFVLVPLAGDSLGNPSLYNLIIPGRERFPHSDYPQKSYNLSLYNLEAMYQSHVLSNQVEPNSEYRVFLLGDSSVWGTLLEPEDTLAGALNSLALTGPDGKPIRFYNLGYPTLSLTKDLLLLENALPYNPDFFVWLFTLESFPEDKQLSSPIVQNNRSEVTEIFHKYQGLDRSLDDTLPAETYWEKTLFSQRRNLADLIRLQLYGVMWAITGIDQYYPSDYDSAARDLSDSTEFHSWEEGDQIQNELRMDFLLAGNQAAGETPILFVNEPVLISQGMNSDIRYNFYYPRWVYDQYRTIVADFMSSNGLDYLDTWNIIPEKEFTNTAIHASPAGVKILAEQLSTEIMELLFP